MQIAIKMANSTPNNGFPYKHSAVSGVFLVMVGLFTFVYSCFDVKVMRLFIGTVICCSLLTIVGMIITFTGLRVLESLVKNANRPVELALLAGILDVIAFCIFCNLAEYFGTFNDVVNDEVKAALYVSIDNHLILSIVAAICLFIGVLVSMYLLYIVNNYRQTTIPFLASVASKDFPYKFIIFSGLTTALVGLFTFIFSYIYSHWLFIATLICCFSLAIIGATIVLAGLKILRSLVDNATHLLVLVIVADILALVSFCLFCYLADEFRKDTDEYIHTHFAFCLISVLLLLIVVILLTFLIFGVNRYRKLAAITKERMNASSTRNTGYPPNSWM